MSEFKRAYDLLRGYVNQEWDRIKSSDLEKAWQELNTPSPPKQVEPKNQEEVANQESESQDHKALARGILGVTQDATFAEIKRSFDRLNSRSNPKNFPEGSAEATNAQKIQTRVNWAYRVLIDDKPATEKRFQSLEIE